MAKGGIQPRKSDGSTNHLFSGRWQTGKTTTMRFPLALKNSLTDIAKYLDKNQMRLNDTKSIVERLEENTQLAKQNLLLTNEIEQLKQELKFQKRLSKDKLGKTKTKKSANRYQIALECYLEYLFDNQLEISSDKLPRKGSIKRQLIDIKKWLFLKSQKIDL